MHDGEESSDRWRKKRGIYLVNRWSNEKPQRQARSNVVLNEKTRKLRDLLKAGGATDNFRG
jgi:hypothetical protein